MWPQHEHVTRGSVQLLANQPHRINNKQLAGAADA